MGVLPQLEAFAKSIITVVGGFGGLVYLVERAYRLIDWFRNRPHLGIRILRETQDAKGLPFVEFEATNLGVATVALEPTIAGSLTSSELSTCCVTAGLSLSRMITVTG